MISGMMERGITSFSTDTILHLHPHPHFHIHSHVSPSLVTDYVHLQALRSSIEKASRALGYEPRTKMKNDIKKIYGWISDKI